MLKAIGLEKTTYLFVETFFSRPEPTPPLMFNQLLSSLPDHVEHSLALKNLKESHPKSRWHTFPGRTWPR